MHARNGFLRFILMICFALAVMASSPFSMPASEIPTSSPPITVDSSISGYHETRDASATSLEPSVKPSIISMTDPSTIPNFAAGGNHTCAINQTGGVRCWGDNTSGQLGNGTTVSQTFPVLVNGIQGTSAVVSAGWQHSCALLLNGEIWCWGENNLHQLGDGTSIDRLSPVKVAGISYTVISFDAGFQHTCAVLSTGSVACWGNNTFGQLGDGTTEDRTTAVIVPGLTGVISVTAGEDHTCALLVSGEAKCWGANEYGQLGDGSTIMRTSPVSVNGLAYAEDISAGYSHTCAIAIGGAVKCWGLNNHYQIGDGTNIAHYVPVPVAGLGEGYAEVETGNGHTCARSLTGKVSCWGFNAYGEVGNGSKDIQPVPADVIGLSEGAISISAGSYHNCVITLNDGGKCWGNNGSGQLGDGTIQDQETPVDTALFRTDAPILESLSPTNAQVNADNVVVIVNGMDLAYGDVAFLNGIEQPTEYLNSNQVVAKLNPGDLQHSGIAFITVKHLDATSISNPLRFELYTFADVLPGSWYYRYVEGFYAEGITTGCAIAPYRYCPDRAVTRAEMAVFILRSLDGLTIPAPSETGMFADVPEAGKDWMRPWIEEFYLDGMTTGCASNPLLYCPERQVTRAEMAVFVLRALHVQELPYTPSPDPSFVGIFDDVPVAGKAWMEPWIEEFYELGITTGCAQNPLRFCPEQSVTRAEMATFLDRAFGFAQLP